ncbi:hypothetical protein MTR67_037788 [Solanum verrucosum]|uniref:Reverse transcriptase zinc-binding domain-containing protein n=1 Tax=Solanum verrucosum TaxID=315347 RepID=A0AAF0ZNT1_SOLVR|nr:hypothetical protein MTR67_037788 [Solanum verrucosum]
MARESGSILEGAGNNFVANMGFIVGNGRKMKFWADLLSNIALAATKLILLDGRDIQRPLHSQRLLQELELSNNRVFWPWEKNWLSKAPLKVSCFSWIVVREASLTHSNLQKRKAKFCSSSSSPWPSVKAVRNYYFSRKVVGLDHLIYNQCNTRRRCHTKFYLLQGGNRDLSCTSDSMKRRINPRTSRILHLLPFASTEDGVSVNGSSRPTTSSDMEDMRLKLDLSLQGEENSSGLVQSLHDAARVIELGLRQQGSLSRVSWFSTAWLGGDRTGWIKVLSYQASVYSLLQAANEILSRGDERDNDINVFTQRSLSRQSAPLESLIRDSLLAKQPEAYEWFWSEQIPAVVTTFVNYFEKDQQFAAATAETRKQTFLSPRNASDVSLLMLALSCVAAIMKLGAAKLSCTQFSSLVPDTLGRLMDMLVEFIPLRQAYHSVKPIGLRREFLVHFGPRAAACRVRNDSGTEEVIFWVSLVQKQLQRAIDRERIWSRLTTSESIELEQAKSSVSVPLQLTLYIYIHSIDFLVNVEVQAFTKAGTLNKTSQRRESIEGKEMLQISEVQGVTSTIKDMEVYRMAGEVEINEGFQGEDCNIITEKVIPLGIQFPEENYSQTATPAWIQQHIMRLSKEFGVDFKGCEENAAELFQKIDRNKLENKDIQNEQKVQKRKGLNELKSLELDTNFMSYGTRSKGGFLAIKDQ